MTKKKLMGAVALILALAMLMAGCSSTVPSPSASASPSLGQVPSPSESPSASPSESPSPSEAPSGGAGQAATDPETIDSIFTELHGILKEYLLSVNENLTEDSFDDGNIPMYIADCKHKGDDEYGSMLDAFGFDASTVDAYIQIGAQINVVSNYLLVLYTEDMDAAEAALDEFHQGQVNTWSNYLPDQYEKVKKNVTGSIGNYLYYVTFDDDIRDDLVSAIENALNAK